MIYSSLPFAYLSVHTFLLYLPLYAHLTNTCSSTLPMIINFYLIYVFKRSYLIHATLLLFVKSSELRFMKTKSVVEIIYCVNFKKITDKRILTVTVKRTTTVTVKRVLGSYLCF